MLEPAGISTVWAKIIPINTAIMDAITPSNNVWKNPFLNCIPIITGKITNDEINNVPIAFTPIVIKSAVKMESRYDIKFVLTFKNFAYL